MFEQRGDSFDTIFATSPPLDKQKIKSRRSRTSPRLKRSLQSQDSTDQESSSLQVLSGGGMMIDDITGNITHIPDSVILNIDSSTNSSSSESEHDVSRHEILEEEEISEEEAIEEEEGIDDEEEEQDDDDGEHDELHCDDWEIRMLAAELNRRESKRDDPISSETTSEADDSSDLLRQRSRHRSDIIDTDTEYSEMESEQMSRPRAASLDQYNLRREKTKGVIKAFSFDRDKDRL